MSSVQSDFELHDIKHIPLADNEPSATSNELDNSIDSAKANCTSNSTTSIDITSVPQQTWSSILCYVIPLSLLKFINAVVASSLTLLIPLYAVKAYPEKGETIAGLIVTCMGIGLVVSSPICGQFISYTTNEFAMIFAAALRTIALIAVAINNDKIYLWIILAVLYGASMSIQNIAVKSFTAKVIKSKKRGRFASVKHHIITLSASRSLAGLGFDV